MFERYFNICLVIAVAIFGVLAFLNFPVFKISNVEIIGNSAVSNETIQRTLEYNGKTVFSFSKKDGEENLRELSYVETVSIRKKLPNTLVVTLEERKVRGYVENMVGQYLYIDKIGRVLEVKNTVDNELPVIVGLKFNNFTVGNILEVDNQSAFDNMVELSNLFLQYNMVDVVRLDVSNADDIQMYIYNIRVIFGDIENAENKMSLTVETLKNISDVENVKGRLDVTDISKAIFSLTS